MSKDKTPGWLRNVNTGVIQTYHPRKAELPFMEPVFEKPELPGRVDRKRKVRPFDEAQLKAKTKAAEAPEEEPESPEAESQDEPVADLFTAEDLDSMESDLNSAMKKEDIANIAMEGFGVEIDQSKGVARADMKDQVRALIDTARKALEAD